MGRTNVGTRQGKVETELLREFLDVSVEEALRSGNTTVRKILTGSKYWR